MSIAFYTEYKKTYLQTYYFLYWDGWSQSVKIAITLQLYFYAEEEVVPKIL